MTHYDPAVIEKYRAILRKEPTSQVFAALAEAYREMGQIIPAEKVVREGLQHHKDFPAGLVVLGKILRDQKKWDEALASVRRAAQLAPENLLAHQMEGDLLLELKLPQEALRAYKMVLFLNPHSGKAKKLVQKLETLTAVDYDDDVFEMTKLKPLQLGSSPRENLEAAKDSSLSSPEITTTTAQASHAAEVSPGKVSTRSLQRVLSLLDAFIVRNDLVKAAEILTQARSEFGDQPEWDQREKLLKNRSQSSLLAPVQGDTPSHVAPRASREKEIQKRKIETLQLLLRKIERWNPSL